MKELVQLSIKGQLKQKCSQGGQMGKGFGQRRAEQRTFGSSPFWTQDNAFSTKPKRLFSIRGGVRPLTTLELFLSNDGENNDDGDDAYDKDHHEDAVNEENKVIDIEWIKSRDVVVKF